MTDRASASNAKIHGFFVVDETRGSEFLRSETKIISDDCKTSRKPFERNQENYRFVYWKLRRAPLRPNFFRSFSLGSRVRRPPRLRTDLNSSLNATKARAIPSLNAPAWPVGPPPVTVDWISNWPVKLVSSKGWLTIILEVSRVKYWSTGRLLTKNFGFSTCFIHTRATASFRLPVA